MKNVDDTLFLELPNGKNVAVKELDPKIQEHVKMFDRLRDDVAEKGYELQVYQTALQVKKQMIEKFLTAMYSQDEPKETTKTEEN